MGKLQEAIFGQSNVVNEQQLSPANTATHVPSRTMFVVVQLSPDGLGAPVGVYTDSAKADAARDMVEPAQVYELTLDASPETD